MSTPYGGNDPQQWGQQPYGSGPPSGGFPSQPGYPQQPPPQGPGQQPGYGQPGYGYPGYAPAPGYAPDPYGQQVQQAPPYGAQPGYPPQQPPPGYPQPPYSQDPYDQPPHGSPGGEQQKTRTGLWVSIGVGVVVIAAAAVLLFWKPGFAVTTTFDSSSVESGVKKILTDSYNITGVGSVSCPSGQEVTDGNTFQCTVMIQGTQKKVTITVKGSDGEYVVGRPK